MTTPSSPAPHDRRGFLAKLLALGLGAIALAVPTLSALAAFLNPWRQKSEAGDLDPRGLDGRAARRRAAATLPRDCRPLGRLERLSGRGHRRDLPLPRQRRASPSPCNRSARTTAAAFPTIRRRRISTALRTARCSICKAAGSTRRASARATSIRLEVEIRDGTEVWVKFEKFQDGTAQKIVKT